MEQERIYNLPENVEKRRLATIEESRRQEELRKQRRILKIEEEKREHARSIQKQIREESLLSKNNSEFENMCGYYGIPVFDATMASNDWERNFLASVKEQLLDGKTMSSRQLDALKRILTTELATIKQINYLVSLGYEGDTSQLTRIQASKLIEEHIQ